METTTERKQTYSWKQINWESESEDDVCKEVEALLENGKSVNQRNMLGETPLFYAVKNRHSKVIKMLLEHGADVEKRNAWGETPLMKAAFLGTPKTIEELVKAGANIEARSADGKTALMMAACCENSDNVKKLLELGAEVNSYDRFSKSPLMIATENDKTESVRLLIEAGAGLEAQNDEGLTALDLAFTKETRDIIETAINRQKEQNKTSEIKKTQESRASLRAKITEKKEEIRKIIADLTKTTPERHALAVRLQNFRKDFGVKARSLAKNDDLIKFLRQKARERS